MSDFAGGSGRGESGLRVQKRSGVCTEFPSRFVELGRLERWALLRQSLKGVGESWATQCPSKFINLACLECCFCSAKRPE